MVFKKKILLSDKIMPVVKDFDYAGSLNFFSQGVKVKKKEDLLDTWDIKLSPKLVEFYLQ
jgi:hypothetical protein